MIEFGKPEGPVLFMLKNVFHEKMFFQNVILESKYFLLEFLFGCLKCILVINEALPPKKLTSSYVSLCGPDIQFL